MSVDDFSYERFLKSDTNISAETAVNHSAELNFKETPCHVKTRKELSLKEKLEILKQYDKLPKMSQRSAAVQLNISQPVLCKILKNRFFIENIMQTNKNSVRKRTRGGKEREVESALKLWYVEVKKRDMPINRNIIRQKAKDIAKQMGKEFAATDGWFTRWRKRENIVCSLFKSKFKSKKQCILLNDSNSYKVPEIHEVCNGTDSSVRENHPNKLSKPQNSLKINSEIQVPNVEVSRSWEKQNENICEVFIKTEPSYDGFESEGKLSGKPPSDEEMLEALQVLRTGVKLRTSDLQFHYDYEHYIYELLKRAELT